MVSIIMSIFEGPIVCINNKYVILNDKRHIIENIFLSQILPGDVVEYTINEETQINIINIKNRNAQALMGIIKNISNGYAFLFCPGLPKFVSLKILCENHYQIGSVVVFKITLNNIEVIYFYDSITNRRNDVKIMLDLYELNSEFTPIKPIYNSNGNPCYANHVNDLTHLDTFNVDPVQSKDFDDAVSIDATNNIIYVHIVDAHNQIKPNSYEDINAFKHCFTLYLPEHNESMLPKYMAEHDLSLIKNCDRETITIEFHIDPLTQNILNYEIYRSIIKIKNRYNYKDFLTVMNNFPLLINFYNKWKIPTLSIPHLKLNIDDKGELNDYYLEENTDDSHKIIETLMVLTNLTISKHVKIPQRYHSKVADELIIKKYTGNDMINAILTIKKYKPAVYDSEKQGHFGLGLETYTHFTSPIRRYFDIIVHRLLAGTTYSNLDNILEHINKREVQIEKIVKLYEMLKIIGFLEKNIHVKWTAYVLNKTNSGLVVFLEDILFELFIFNSNNNYSLGDKVIVQIKKIDWLALNIKATIIV